MEVKRYSKSTIESYNNALPVFFSDYHTKHADEITNKDVLDFNTHYILKKNLSATYPSQFINALKLFYQTFTSKRFTARHIPQKEILCNKREKPLRR
jgi:site-specific recombinase XerD